MIHWSLHAAGAESSTTKLNGNFQPHILTQSMAVIFVTMSLERMLSNGTTNLKHFLYPGSKQMDT